MHLFLRFLQVFNISCVFVILRQVKCVVAVMRHVPAIPSLLRVAATNRGLRDLVRPVASCALCAPRKAHVLKLFLPLC